MGLNEGASEREIMKYKPGDRVNYHATIGGDVYSTDHEVLSVHPKEETNYGQDVAFISGKSGCVATAALSPAKPEAAK